MMPELLGLDLGGYLTPHAINSLYPSTWSVPLLDFGRLRLSTPPAFIQLGTKHPVDARNIPLM
jgi:hypothetical protein